MSASNYQQHYKINKEEWTHNVKHIYDKEKSSIKKIKKKMMMIVNTLKKLCNSKFKLSLHKVKKTNYRTITIKMKTGKYRYSNYSHLNFKGDEAE